jgi:hypothetical protein
MEMFADADFAGLWGAERPTDSTSANSRSGYLCILVSMIGSTPVIWSSKMQTEIALSTCEAEYIALSTAMKVLLPLRELFKSLSEALKISRDEVAKVFAVWEDNDAALKLATSQFPNMTPKAHRSLVVSMTTTWRCHRFESWLVYGDPSLGLPTMLVEEVGLKIVVFNVFFQI